MKLSTKLIYGLQFLLNLTEKNEKEFIQIKEVVRKESISEKYLENIVSQLKSSGLLIVKRGAQGGYKLSRSQDKITLKEIFQILEGLELMPEGVGNGDNASLNMTVVSSMVSNFEGLLIEKLEQMTLKELQDSKIELMNYSNYQI